MALTYKTVTFPCSVNSVPFYPAASMQRALDASPNWGQAPYINTVLDWQTPLQYNNKRLFTDYMTFQFKTQKNSNLVLTLASPTHTHYSYTNNAKLYVCGCVNDPATGNPVPGAVISAFTAVLNPTITSVPDGGAFWGIQTAPYDIYTNPVDFTAIPLASYMWQFTFGDALTPATDSGIYFLRFDNIDADGGIDRWYSEPIFVYGTDAATYPPETLEFEATNVINKSDIIIDGWASSAGKRAVFTTRIEADILDYDPKGVYMGFLNSNWLASQTYTKSWKTFVLNIGTVCAGIPGTMFEIITKFMELDTVVINNQFYVYDIQSGGSASPSGAWKMDKTRVNKLMSGSLPIRYKYENQFYAGNPITYIHRFDPSRFDPSRFH